MIKAILQEMELQVLMIVRKGASKYLLVEDHSKKLLHFPTQSASASQSQNDVKMTAQLLLDEVCYMSSITNSHMYLFIGSMYYCQVEGYTQGDTSPPSSW